MALRIGDGEYYRPGELEAQGIRRFFPTVAIGGNLYVPRSELGALADGLEPDRVEAWDTLIPCVQAAGEAGMDEAAFDAFVRGDDLVPRVHCVMHANQGHVSLSDLIALDPRFDPDYMPLGEAQEVLGAGRAVLEELLESGKLAGRKGAAGWCCLRAAVANLRRSPRFCPEEYISAAEASKALRVSTGDLRHRLEKGAVHGVQDGVEWYLPRPVFEKLLAAAGRS